MSVRKFNLFVGLFSGCRSPPVLLSLGGELVVKGGGAAVDAVGGGGGSAILHQCRIWQVQHRLTLKCLQAGCGEET